MVKENTVLSFWFYLDNAAALFGCFRGPCVMASPMWRIHRQRWLLLTRVSPALKLRSSGVVFLAAALSIRWDTAADLFLDQRCSRPRTRVTVPRPVGGVLCGNSACHAVTVNCDTCRLGPSNRISAGTVPLHPAYGESWANGAAKHRCGSSQHDSCVLWQWQGVAHGYLDKGCVEVACTIVDLGFSFSPRSVGYSPYTFIPY